MKDSELTMRQTSRNSIHTMPTQAMDCPPMVPTSNHHQTRRGDTCPGTRPLQRRGCQALPTSPILCSLTMRWRLLVVRIRISIQRTSLLFLPLSLPSFISFPAVTPFLKLTPTQRHWLRRRTPPNGPIRQSSQRSTAQRKSRSTLHLCLVVLLDEQGRLHR